MRCHRTDIISPLLNTKLERKSTVEDLISNCVGALHKVIMKAEVQGETLYCKYLVCSLKASDPSLYLLLDGHTKYLVKDELSVRYFWLHKLEYVAYNRVSAPYERHIFVCVRNSRDNTMGVQGITQISLRSIQWRQN